MPRRASALALALPLLGLTGCLFFSSPPDTRLKTSAEMAAATAPLDEAGVARWREAGHRIVKALSSDHPNPWFRLSRPEFQRRMEALDRDLPRLTERQVVLRWKLVFAALGDEHTSLWEQSTFTEMWPLQVRSTPAGVFITAAGSGFTDLLGARLVRVGDRSAEAFLDALKAFFPAAVPSYGTTVAARLFPYGWVWLKDVGSLPPEAEAVIEVAWTDGRRETRSIPTLGSGKVAWTRLPVVVPLLRNMDPERNYTFQVIEEGRTLYIRYRACRNQEGQESVWAFTGRVRHETKGKPLQRVLVDLRGNGGGNSLLFWRMERWLGRHPAFSRPGGLIVLTDSNTFSSGFMAAWNLQKAGGRVVGTEPGQPLNAYGQIRFTPLPELRPAFACSTKAFMYRPGDAAAWSRSLKVDVPTPETREDALGLTDSALATALAMPYPTL